MRSKDLRFRRGCIMNLEAMINELKKQRLNKWENYLQFVKDPNNYKGVSHKISICSAKDFLSVEYAHLFEYLPEYEKLKKFTIPGLENEKTVFCKALTIMHWLTQNTYYSGAQLELLPDDSLKILDFSFGKGFEYAINCRSKAIVLTDLLIAHNIMAYPICLEDENHCGNHFVVHIFCSDENKWVVLDPSFNCYFQNKSGMTLNIFELRELRLKNENPTIIDYSFNGTNECMDIYLQYFICGTLTYITTWKSNSNDKRDSFYNRKEFKANPPMVVPTIK